MQFFNMTDKGKKKKKVCSQFCITVKPVHNDHPWDPQKVVVVQSWFGR